uniref:AP24 protein n=1 Tax=Patella vulgata TaxID=6465 RepID=J7Q5J5_PATVU|nr:AP24 protein [Patella vulgata]
MWNDGYFQGTKLYNLYKMASGGLYLFITAVLITVCVIYSQHSEDTIADGQEPCITYQGKAESRFSNSKKVTWIPAIYQNTAITEITIIERSSFYICYHKYEEPIQYKEPIQNFGTNRTHWYVKKGCSGTFWITECPLEGTQEF